MKNYPRKIRARRERGLWVITEMAPGANGTWYAKERIQTEHVSMQALVADGKELQVLLGPEDPPAPE